MVLHRAESSQRSEKEKVGLSKKRYMNVYSDFTHSYKKVETTKMSFNWQMDKKTVVRP